MAGTTDISLTWIQTLDEAMEFKRWLGERRTWLAVDTETGGLDWWRDDLRTVQFGDRHRGWCMEWKWWAGLAAEALREYEGPIAMHNAKFDTHFLEVNGAPVKRWLVHDTRAMAHILSPAERSGLKPRAAKVLGPWATHGEDDLKIAMTKGGWDWATVPVELLWQYAAFDTVITAQLADELYPWVAKDYSSIYELEIASTQVLTDMERRGVKIDQDYLSRSLEEWAREQQGAAHQLKASYHIQNPASDQQVMRALEREVGWRPLVFTEKGNPKLDDEILAPIDHPVAQLTRHHREFHRMANTARSILDLTDLKTSRLHSSINPLGARTGRMSSSRPNLQNLPAGDSRVRNAVTVEPENIGVKSDFDQIEMRLFAHYSGDENMLAGIRYGDSLAAEGKEGYDLHSVAARMVFGIGWDEEVPKKLRKRVKAVSFGKVYGSGLEKFAATSGLSLSEAQQAINAYEAAFPESRRDAFPSRIAETLVRRQREQGDPYVLTAYGRKEPCWPSEAYKAVNYCLAPDTLILRADLRHVPADQILVGDRLVAFDEHPIDEGSGKKYHRMRTATVEAASVVVKQSLTVHTADGQDSTCSTDHLWLARSAKAPHRGPRLRWMRADELRPGDFLLSLGTWQEDQSRLGGYLAGLYDGEGCLTTRTAALRSHLTFSQNPGAVMDTFLAGAQELGLPMKFQKRSPSSTSPCDNVTTSSIRDTLRVLGTLQPHRFQSRFEDVYEGAALTGGMAPGVEIVQIEDAGERTLSSIQTSTRTLVANGFLSHNCIQGTAADVLKAKLVELSRTWLGDHMLLPIHDEILFEVPEGTEHDAIRTIQEVMPERERFAVPLTTEAQTFRRWGEGYDE